MGVLHIDMVERKDRGEADKKTMTGVMFQKLSKESTGGGGRLGEALEFLQVQNDQILGRSGHHFLMFESTHHPNCCLRREPDHVGKVSSRQPHCETYSVRVRHTGP